MATTDAKETLATWETSSQYWNKHQALIEEMFAPLTHALIEAARIGPGQSVVDIGGGSGEPSLTIAGVVGEKGSVSYTDPAAGMVTAARDEAERKALGNIQFHQSPAEQLSFADDSYDVAVSRLSAMFFADVPRALGEIMRVLRPGGRVSLLVWSTKEVNPFFNAVTTVMDRFVPAEPADEDAPEAFRFAKPRKLAKALSDAGAESVSEQTFSFTIAAPINVEQFWQIRTEMSDTFRKKLARLVPDQVAAIKYTVQKAVAKYFKSGTMSFPAEVLIITGTKLK